MLKLTRRDVREISTGVLFLLPNILGFLAFTTIPLAISLFMAFTDWNLEMHNMFQNQELRSVGFANYSIANSFRKALETVLTNCPECAKSDCKSWRGRIENSFNKLAAGI